MVGGDSFPSRAEVAICRPNKMSQEPPSYAHLGYNRALAENDTARLLPSVHCHEANISWGGGPLDCRQWLRKKNNSGREQLAIQMMSSENILPSLTIVCVSMDEDLWKETGGCLPCKPSQGSHELKSGCARNVWSSKPLTCQDRRSGKGVRYPGSDAHQPH